MNLNWFKTGIGIAIMLTAVMPAQTAKPVISALTNVAS